MKVFIAVYFAQNHFHREFSSHSFVKYSPAKKLGNSEFLDETFHRDGKYVYFEIRVFHRERVVRGGSDISILLGK